MKGRQSQDNLNIKATLKQLEACISCTKRGLDGDCEGDGTKLVSAEEVEGSST